jgi:hypothetical protein
MDTALGNCLIMCAMVFAYAVEKGIDIELCNNGDDCQVFMESEYAEKFVDGLDEWFETMGFTMKVEKPVHIFERVEFCKTQPVWLGNAWRMVRHPKSINKDAITLLPINTLIALQRWWHDMGYCGGALNSGTPISQSYYRMLRRWSSGAGSFGSHLSVETGMWNLAKGMELDDREITESARLSYWKAFGIPPHIQRCEESYYDGLKPCAFDPVKTAVDSTCYQMRNAYASLLVTA